MESTLDRRSEAHTVLIYRARKSPCGSSNFSGKLSLHDSFSMGLIMLSSKEKTERKNEQEGECYRKSRGRNGFHD